jgi:uncharacterized protein YkwD
MLKKLLFAVLSGIMIVPIVVLSACSSGVSQADYDRLNNELNALQGQLAQAQQELAQSQNVTSGYLVSGQQYDELSSRYAALENNFQVLTAEQEKLRQDYDLLKHDYDLLTTTNISTGDVEQAIFSLINQERSRNGLGELAWGKNLYLYAIANDQNMADSRSEEYSTYASWQDIYWATGYPSVGDITDATMTIWKNRDKFQANFLNVIPGYGAVAVYQSGDIYYITYIASQFP